MTKSNLQDYHFSFDVFSDMIFSFDAIHLIQKVISPFLPYTIKPLWDLQRRDIRFSFFIIISFEIDL